MPSGLAPDARAPEPSWTSDADASGPHDDQRLATVGAGLLTAAEPALSDAPGTRPFAAEPAAAGDEDARRGRHGDRAPAGEAGDSALAERGAWSIVWLGVISGGLAAWGQWTASASMGVLGPAVVLMGMGGLAVTWRTTSPRTRAYQLGTLAVVVASVVASQYGPIHTRRFYTTDSAAFDHLAVAALAHGSDPYRASMAAARNLLEFPRQYWTYTVNGGHVNDVSYPAGSFLVLLPAWLLGLRHEVVDWVDLVAWLVTGGLVFALVPRALRFLAGLLLVVPLFVGIFSTGGTDATFLPFLVLALWRWDRYGLGAGAGVASWIGPVALGAACSIKQSPWFCVPFLVAGVALEAHRRGARPGPLALRYLAVTAGVFGVVNLPFALWAPGPWWHGTLTPLVEPLVADGQGLVSLATHGIVGGVDLTWLGVCGALALLGVLGAFVSTYPAMKWAWLFVVPVALYVSPRSLSTYLVDFVPAALVGALTVASPRSLGVGPARAQPKRSRPRRAIVLGTCGLPLAGAVVSGAVAFTTAPLAVSAPVVTTQDHGLFFASLRVTLRNTTSRPVTAHLTLTAGPNLDGFWSMRGGGSPVVAPGAARTVTVFPPGLLYTPTRGQQWLVSVYSLHPDALSTSPLQVGVRPPPR